MIKELKYANPDCHFYHAMIINSSNHSFPFADLPKVCILVKYIDVFDLKLLLLQLWLDKTIHVTYLVLIFWHSFSVPIVRCFVPTTNTYSFSFVLKFHSCN